jgi:hypothetical protein
MRILWSRPRLGGLIAPRLAFLGLFSETLEARPAPTRRGIARVDVLTHERVAQPQLYSPGTLHAKTLFLRVHTRSHFACMGLLRRALSCGLT